MTSMNKHNILLVDDEPNILSTLGQLLDEGYNTFSATNGEDALSIMEQEDMALIISDHRMPGMTGSELLETVLQKYPNTIRLIISGYIDQKMLMNVINRGHAHGILTKPWEGDVVRFVVERWLQQYERLREVESKARQCEHYQRQLAEANKQRAELTSQLEQSQQLLEYHQKPWYKRWFAKKG